MRQLLHLILFGEQEAVSAIFAEDSSGNKMTLSDTAGIDELDAAAKARSLMHTPAISRLGFAVQFVVQSLRGAEGMGGPILAPVLVELLPHLFKCQVCQQ